jgi:hypothetical protein
MFSPGSQACFVPEFSQQPVGFILKQGTDVELCGLHERALQQCDLSETKRLAP